jgi:hypothetical protein
MIKVMENRRGELRKKLIELYPKAFNVKYTHRESLGQKEAQEEYKKLFAEYMTLPISLGTLVLKKVVRFELPDGTIIKPSQRSVYIQGRAFTLERDKDGKFIKAKGTVVDHEVGQQVSAEYTIEVKPEALEAIRNLDEKPITIKVAPQTSSLPDQKTIDWLMLKRKCPRCHFENSNAMLERAKCCSNCTLPINDWEKYIKENGKDSKEYEGPKKINYKPLGFRNFLNRNKEVE